MTETFRSPAAWRPTLSPMETVSTSGPLTADAVARAVQSIREPLPNRVRRLLQLSLRVPVDDSWVVEELASAATLLLHASRKLRNLELGLGTEVTPSQDGAEVAS